MVQYIAHYVLGLHMYHISTLVLQLYGLSSHLFVQLIMHYKSLPFHFVICIHLILLSCHIFCFFCHLIYFYGANVNVYINNEAEGKPQFNTPAMSLK